MAVSTSINPGGSFSSKQAARWAHDHGLPIVPSYLGQVATRSYIPTAINVGPFKSGNGQTFHVAQDDIDWLQVSYANYYVNNAVHEAGTGGTLTVTASIQYPIAANPPTGTWQRFTWNGSYGTGAISDGETSALSDALKLAVAIPRGQAFLLRWHAEASVVIPYWQHASQQNFAAWNQICETGTSSNGFSDKTTGGNIAAGAGSINLYPDKIVSQTTRPSFLIFGDSRAYGKDDTCDAAGRTGIFARALGKEHAFTNCAVQSERLTDFLAASTRRRALIPYFSHVICNASINDLILSPQRTAAQLKADIETLAGLVKAEGRGYVHATLEPYTPNGTYTGQNGTGQQPSMAEAQRLVINDLLRSRQVAGVDRVIDVAAAVEVNVNSGTWGIDADGPLTSDGLHCNARGYRRIENRAFS